MREQHEWLSWIIQIPLPDSEAVVAIIKPYAGAMISTKDLQTLAPKLAGKTGADIEALVRAAKATARRARHSFSIQDLEQQVPGPLQSLPLQVQRRIRVYRNGQRVVAQVLGFAEMIPDNHPDLGQLLAKAVQQERFPTEHMCNDILAITMAGRASEEIVFGDVSVFGSGVPESDLAVATTIAKDMEMRAGFGEVGVIYLGGNEDWPHCSCNGDRQHSPPDRSCTDGRLGFANRQC